MVTGLIMLKWKSGHIPILTTSKVERVDLRVRKLDHSELIAGRNVFGVSSAKPQE